VEERTRTRRMPPGILARERRLEFLEQAPLLGRQVDRRLDHDAAQQVARRVAAHRAHALAAQAEQLAGLGFGRHLDLRLAVERRHHEFVAERGLREADRHLAIEVVAITLADLVLAHAHFDVAIARRRAAGAGFAPALQADAIAVVDARRDLDRERLLVLDPATAAAALAWLADALAAAATARAGLLHREDALLHPHAALAAAGRAGLDRAVLGTRAVARL